MTGIQAGWAYGYSALKSVELEDWGWDAAFAENADPAFVPARITAEHRREYRVVTARGDMTAIAPGKMFRGERINRPVVGDWVVLETGKGAKAVIRAVLPRRTLLSRQAAGEKAVPQPVAANADEVWVFADLSVALNLARLERFVAAALSSGAQVRLLLSKADLVDDPEATAAAVRQRFAQLPSHVFCSITGFGLDAVRKLLKPRCTVALLGPSGVGKSTLVNVLAGETLMAVGEVRAGDRKGRHTTTHRALLRLPGGALVIDTPGIREVGLWDAQDGVSQSFEDIEALAAVCRFRNCRHDREPGCEVRAAVERGEVEEVRVRRYLKLLRQGQEAGRRGP